MNRQQRRNQRKYAPKCDRCKGTPTAQDRHLWNVTVKQGIIVGFLCPNCQTVEEDLEAQVNEATIDYQGVDAFGRLVGRPKMGEE